jgi:hypothetical protein
MKTLNDIQNSTSKVWTNKQLAETVKQAKQNGLIVNKGDEFVTITDPTNGRIILRSLKMSPTANIVRIDGSYFGDCNFIDPVFIYIDKSNYIVSMTPEDIEANRNIDSFRRFVIERSNLNQFCKYYQLQFHPLTKRNKVA